MNIKTKINQIVSRRVQIGSAVTRTGALLLAVATVFSLADIGTANPQRMFRRDAVMQVAAVSARQREGRRVAYPLNTFTTSMR